MSNYGGLSGAAAFMLGRASHQYEQTLGNSIQRALYGRRLARPTEADELADLLSQMTSLLRQKNAESDRLEEHLLRSREYASGLEAQIKDLKDTLALADAATARQAVQLKSAGDREKRLACNLEAAHDKYHRLSDDHTMLKTKAENMERRIWSYLSMENEWRKRQS
ncbi:hypothetical protein K6L44_06905 [Gluconacetobacter entanii]|uniref:hypothetical protein n=1 Tax=Gluconacetobacter entanii TaxID=108528 RepID=UPI001C932355|nr:hypothetical protein [Gluconacetobacter entanii]MBY4639729.1 hypothetical protein [Gluconacetobacter entanii]MCW4580364.1 hypothetical protein [Gluconacetobacter entanii]MCW4583693.1 hypothetical protein [Gluconacetobacter entanii]MCW4587027.1 hypothetical protein [Gluconacetobacter entanii]